MIIHFNLIQYEFDSIRISIRIRLCSLCIYCCLVLYEPYVPCYLTTLLLGALFHVSLKPIFHQNAKYLVSGTFASPNAKDSTFASPNARNTNMLVSLALGDASFLRWPYTFLFFCVDFFALGSKRKHHFQWNIDCVGCLASTRRQPVFLWNMGLRP